MPSRLRHLVISTQDPDQTAAFFKDTFGFREAAPSSDSPVVQAHFLSDGHINLSIFRFKTDAAAGPVGKDFIGLHHIGIQVDDLQATVAKFQAAGLPRNDIDIPFGKAKQQDVNDPHSRLNFMSPDGIPIDINSEGWYGTD